MLGHLHRFPDGPIRLAGGGAAAVDAWVADYNAQRPHQALDPGWEDMGRLADDGPDREADPVKNTA
jgi:hypothetical protein